MYRSAYFAFRDFLSAAQRLPWAAAMRSLAGKLSLRRALGRCLGDGAFLGLGTQQTAHQCDLMIHPPALKFEVFKRGLEKDRV